MLKFLLSVFLLIALPLAASAQEVPTRENMICSTYLRIWDGTKADVQNIQLHPVPDSFRDVVETTGCRNTHPSDLIAWHRKYGSEETMVAALKYLEVAVKKWGVGIISRGKDAKPTAKHRTEDYAILARYYTMAANAFPSLEFIKSAERYEKKTKTLCDELTPDWSNPPWNSGCRKIHGVREIDKLSLSLIHI